MYDIQHVLYFVPYTVSRLISSWIKAQGWPWHKFIKPLQTTTNPIAEAEAAAAAAANAWHPRICRLMMSKWLGIFVGKLSLDITKSLHRRWLLFFVFVKYSTAMLRLAGRLRQQQQATTILFAARRSSDYSSVLPGRTGQSSLTFPEVWVLEMQISSVLPRILHLFITIWPITSHRPLILHEALTS